MSLAGKAPAPEARAGVSLTDRQAEVYQFVVAYHRLVREPCPAQAVVSRFGLHHETVRDHFAALYRKGYLAGESSPATPVHVPLQRPA